MRSNFSYSFRRWYGKTLSPLQRSIIERLERQRYYHPKRQVRAFVADDGSHGDSITRILTAYLLWHKTQVSPALDAAIYARTKKSIPRSSFLTPHSTRSPHSGHGCTYGLVLAIDCHKIHGRQSFDDLRSTLQPMVGSTHGSVLIYVGSPRCRWKQRPRFRTFTRAPLFAWAYHSPPPRWISVDSIADVVTLTTSATSVTSISPPVTAAACRGATGTPFLTPNSSFLTQKLA